MFRHLEPAQPVLTLSEPELPTRRELLARLRRANPDLTVVWLPPAILLPLSWLAIAIQKILRPRSPAISVAKIFARLRYDTSRVRGLAPAIKVEAFRLSRAHNGTGATARSPMDGRAVGTHFATGEVSIQAASIVHRPG